ncbi:homoserine dehydrogenase, partial [Enterococcus faecalis]
MEVKMKDTLQIGLLGLGTVGTGVLTLLKEHQEKISQVTGRNVVIEKAFVRNLETKQAHELEYGLSLTTSSDDILEDN